MLNLVPPPQPQMADVQQLLQLVEAGRPVLHRLCLLAVALLVVVLFVAGVLWGAGLVTGCAASVWLGRHGPPWWPGRG